MWLGRRTSSSTSHLFMIFMATSPTLHVTVSLATLLGRNSIEPRSGASGAHAEGQTPM
jgi:hypothetical protein